MPRAVDIQVLLSRLLAPGDGRTHFLAEDLRAAAGQGIEPGILQSTEGIGDRHLCQPGQVQDLNRSEAFQLQARVQRPQRPEHVRVVTERQGRVEPPDDVQFGDAQLQRLAGLRDDLRDAKLKPVRVARLARKRTELAAQDAVVRVVDVAVQDIARPVADPALPGKVGDGPDGVQIFALKKAQRVGL